MSENTRGVMSVPMAFRWRGISDSSEAARAAFVEHEAEPVAPVTAPIALLDDAHPNSRLVRRFSITVQVVAGRNDYTLCERIATPLGYRLDLVAWYPTRAQAEAKAGEMGILLPDGKED